jgi:hypothetical protein
LGAGGKPDTAKSRDSALGIGIPGTVAGLALANSIAVTSDGLLGAPDPRTRGAEAAGNQLCLKCDRRRL